MFCCFPIIGAQIASCEFLYFYSAFHPNTPRTVRHGAGRRTTAADSEGLRTGANGCKRVRRVASDCERLRTVARYFAVHVRPAPARVRTVAARWRSVPRYAPADFAADCPRSPLADSPSAPRRHPHGALADVRRVRRARSLAVSRRLADWRQCRDSKATVTRQRVRGTAGRYQCGGGGFWEKPRFVSGWQLASPSHTPLSLGTRQE